MNSINQSPRSVLLVDHRQSAPGKTPPDNQWKYAYSIAYCKSIFEKNQKKGAVEIVSKQKPGNHEKVDYVFFSILQLPDI